MSETVHDVVVVGGGAAGLSAALFSTRRGLKTLLLSEDIGGQAATTARIENYPGLEPIDGLELMHRIKKQAEQAGAQVIMERVEQIKTEKKGFALITAHGTYPTRTIILADGLTHRKLNVPGEDKLTGKGLSYSAVHDLSMFHGQPVAVIGGGNSAMDAALSLAVHSPSVTMVTVNPELRGERVLIDRVDATKNIRVIKSAKTTEILGNQSVTGLKIEHQGKSQTLEVQGIFVEIGYAAKPSLLKELVDLDEKNQVIINPVNNATSRPGIFAAGDITNITQRQIVISAGEGAKAALGVAEYLERLGTTDYPEREDWTHVVPTRHISPPTYLPTTQKKNS